MLEPVRWFSFRTARPLLQIGAPIILTQFSSTAMSFVDAWMVGALGKDPLAAILPAGLLFFISISLVLGAHHTVNTFVSQCYGQNRYRDCGVYTWQAIWLSLYFSILLLPAALVPPSFFELFGHEAAVAALERDYFSVSILGAAPLLCNLALANFFIGIQRPRVPMMAAFTALGLNVFLNWVLIYGKLGAPMLGLAGAAWGTVIANTFQAAILFAWFLSKSIKLRYSTSKARWRKTEFFNLIRIGLPSGVQSLIELTAWGVVLVWFIGHFGTIDLAATTIIVRYMHLSFLPLLGLGGALTALAGQAIGAEDWRRAHELTRNAISMGGVYILLFCLLFVGFREELVRLFTKEPEIIALATKLILVIAILEIGFMAQLLYGSALRAAGDTAWIARWTFGLCIVVMGAGGILCITLFPQWGSLGPWSFTTSYILILGTLFAIRWHRDGWRQIRLFQQREEIAT